MLDGNFITLYANYYIAFSTGAKYHNQCVRISDCMSISAFVSQKPRVQTLADF